MRYCVVKNTTIVIDGSGNHNDIMYKNAQSSGFAKDQVEILTQEQYETRKAIEPIPNPPTDKERIIMLEDTVNYLLGL